MRNGAGAAALLAGPRGRRACWEWLGAPRLTPSEAPREIRESVRRGAAGTVSAMTALSRAVGVAAYWQPPGEEDDLLTRPEVVAELLPVANRLLEDPAVSWWGSPLADGRQWLTQLLHEPTSPTPPAVGDPHEALRAWRDEQLRLNEDFGTVRREGFAELDVPLDGWQYGPHRRLGDGPAEHYASLSGHWWSTPDRQTVAVTTRNLAEHGPVALSLTEDEMGWGYAHCWAVAVTGAPRVHEIDGPGAWAELVYTYPLDVTDSRRPDWGRTTNHDGPWLVPDWPAVARDHDAVHLSVLGYLSTAGLPVAVGDDHWTLLAGWDPDATFWLSDALRPSAEAERWAADDTGEWGRTD